MNSVLRAEPESFVVRRRIKNPVTAHEELCAWHFLRLDTERRPFLVESISITHDAAAAREEFAVRSLTRSES